MDTPSVAPSLALGRLMTPHSSLRPLLPLPSCRQAHVLGRGARGGGDEGAAGAAGAALRGAAGGRRGVGVLSLPFRPHGRAVHPAQLAAHVSPSQFPPGSQRVGLSGFFVHGIARLYVQGFPFVVLCCAVMTERFCKAFDQLGSCLAKARLAFPDSEASSEATCRACTYPCKNGMHRVSGFALQNPCNF